MDTYEITFCGLPSWIGIQRNDTAAFINNILLAAVNGSSAIFAFLSNLAVIVTIIKTPSLQKPCNILLCSLAIADCLTGVTAQPMFIVWRFFLQRAQQSCLHQALVFDVYYTISISLPLVYHSSTLLSSVLIAYSRCLDLWCI